ncbi:uncharacterized protein J4E78_005010 [Alternaria triticimaculans]|uniref:uncharacterized protein n=1 Tax=Alternaria triticimaculans TaxID=297637 RepID=UPI0020C5581A|nr:uncharacterized protein J4E78_005010 [Alternaria triticimaculans]KAI4660309.1 hypothetical protein J4E78_005010 [Alternaria triticimaculans]
MEMKAPQREKEEEVNGHVRNDMSTSEKSMAIANPQPDIELYKTNTPQSMPKASPTHQPPQASKSNKITSPPDTHPVDVPPNGGYGWICVAAVATINGHTWGLNSAYAVFLAHYLSTSTFSGATPLQYAFIGGLSISQALIVSPVATYTTRRFGTRTTLFIGVFFETVSFIGASFASSIWHLFLSQGVCFGWGMGFLFVSFDHTLFRKPQFIGLLAFGVLSMLGYIVLLFSLPSYARTIGLTANQGSIIGAVFNLGQALGRPPIGYFSDSIGRLNMAGSMTFLVGVFCLLIWIFAKSFGVLVFFSLLGGCVAGTFWATAAPVTTEVMGLRDLPSALSITWLVLVLPTTFSEPIGLEIVAFNGGSYTGAILFTGWMYIGAAVCLWMVRTWKIGEDEENAAAAAKEVVGPTPAEAESFQRSPFVKRMFMIRKV